MSEASNPIPGSTADSLSAKTLGPQPGGDLDVGVVTWSLGERVKELCCLYAVSEACDRSTLSLDESIQSIADIIPPSWQYPDICSARVAIEGREYRSGRFASSQHVQSQPIVVEGRVAGTLEVFYSEDRPKADEGPFLHEERQLIDDIALRIGKLIESRSMQRGLDETEARRRALLAITSETILELDGDGVLHDFHVGDHADATPLLTAVHRASVHNHRGRYVPQPVIEEGMVRVCRVISTGVPETYEQRVGANGSARDFEVRIAKASSTRALVSVREIAERRTNQWAMATLIGQTHSQMAKNLERCVCQELADVAQLAEALATDLPAVMERASELVERVDGALVKSRGMASCLCPTRLETDGLLPALLDLAKHLETTAKLNCRVTHSGRLPCSYIVSLQLFRIAREALENMVRNGAPEHVRIHVECHQGLTTLRLDAEGTPPLDTNGDATGSLEALRIQAAAIGATLELGVEAGRRSVVCRVAATGA